MYSTELFYDTVSQTTMVEEGEGEGFNSIIAPRIL
jgi:hypothetical protein